MHPWIGRLTGTLMIRYLSISYCKNDSFFNFALSLNPPIDLCH